MSESRESSEELELKKRARRRLVGAVAFATLAAVVLPMVMDEAPPLSGQDIELKIPGQDQPARPLLNAKPPAAGLPVAGQTPVAAEKPVAAPSPAKPAEAVPAKPVAAPPSKPADAPSAKLPETPPAKPTPPVAAKPAADDARRARAILDTGQTTADATGTYVVLIGAFANPANVKNLQTKLGQLGIRTYTEMLESSQGRKTRVRAGPFPSREVAEQALEKMKKIGVDGVVAAKS